MYTRMASGGDTSDVKTDGHKATPARRPMLRAVPFGGASGQIVQLLTERQQAQLAAIATEQRVTPRTVIYRADTTAECIFLVQTGVVKSFRDLPSGKRRVMGFLFPGDVFGLAEGGYYVNTTQAVTEGTLYRISRSTLADALRADNELELQFLCKVTHELRESQRQRIAMARRDAPGRLVMFLRMLESHRDGDSSRIEVPMSRADIGHFLGLSPEAVSRGTARLERDGVVSFLSAHVARVVNRSRFERIATSV